MSRATRIAEHPLLGPYERGPLVSFTFDGEPVEGHEREPLGVALMAAGVLRLRVSRGGEARGLYCAIGQCLECRVEIDGVGVRRACLTPVSEGLAVRTHRDPGAGDA